MRRFTWAALVALFVCGSVAAQGTQFSDDVMRPTAVIPGASVRVCTEGGTGTPCTPLATIYSDQAMTSAIAGSILTADTRGRFTFYAPAGCYQVQVSAAGFSTLTYADCRGSGTGVFTDLGVVSVGATGATVTPTGSAPGVAQESTTGGSIADDTYYCVTTLVNLNGETTATPEQSVTISAGTGTAQIVSTLTGREWTTGAFAFKLYCGTVSGGPYYLQTPRTFTSTMDNNTVSRDANDFVTLTLTGTASLGLGVGYSITVAGATGCTDNPNGTFRVYSHTAVASPASSSVTFKHAGATESGCGGAAITVTWSAPGVFTAADVGAATNLIGAHLVRGNIILTSIAGSGANPPSTNTATIDDVQVAINAARVAGSLAAGASPTPNVEKAVQLAEGNDQISGGKFFYGITTPLILSTSDRLIGNATTVTDTTNQAGTMLWARASGTGAGVNALWDDVYDRIGVVMVMNSTGTDLRDANINADGTHAVLVYQSEGDSEASANIRLIGGTWKTVGTGANCPAALRTMARIYYFLVADVNFAPSTTTDCFATSGHPRGASIMMSNGAGSEWVFRGPVRTTTPGKHDFVQNRMGPTDPDRGVNRSGFTNRNSLVFQNWGHFQATAGGGTGVICRCENTIVNFNSSPGPADYNVSAGTDAAYIFGANSYGAGGAQTFYKSSLLSTANNASTVKFTNSTDRLELIFSTMGGSSTLVDFNNFSMPLFALFSGPSDLCDPRASYFANRVTTPGSGSNNIACIGSLASNTADRREGPHMYVQGGIIQQGFLANLDNARHWCIPRENAGFRDCYYKDPDTTAQRISSTSLTTGVTQFYGADGSTVIFTVDKANNLVNSNNVLFVGDRTSAGINAAIAAASAGDTIILMRGSYTWDATVTVNKALKIYMPGGTFTATVADAGQFVGVLFNITANDVTIEGAGWNTILKKTGTSDQQALISSGALDRITVRNLKLDGDEASHTTVSSKFYTCWVARAGATDLLLDNVEVTGCGNRAIDWRGVNRARIEKSYFHQTGIATVAATPLDGNATSVDVDGATVSTDVWFVDNQFEEWGDSAIAAPSSNRVHVIGNTLRGRADFGNTALTTESGIDLLGVTDAEVIGNVVREVRGPVLGAECTGSVVPTNIRIVGNQFYNVASLAAGDPRVTLGQGGVSCQPKDFVLTGNTFVGTRVAAAGIDNLVVSGNTFRNRRSSVGSAILVDLNQGAGGTAKNFTFASNTVTDDNATITTFVNVGSAVTAPGNSSFVNNVLENVANQVVYQAGAALVPEIWPDQASDSWLVRRVRASQGTALVVGDFALSAGCGSTASVSAVAANSRDQNFEFDLTSSGTGQGANTCTITFTFKDGTFTNAPNLICQRNDLVATAGTIAHTTKSATAPVLTFKGTPVDTEVYKIACSFVGN